MVEERDPSLPTASPGPDLTVIEAREFETSFGEPLARTLDLDTWQPGENLAALYGRLEKEVEEAVRQENRLRERIRQKIFPLLRSRPGAPGNAGVYTVRPEDIEKVHLGLLFNGAVEACDGTSVINDRLPVTIAQIGICLVSYQGDQGSWVHRLYRRDLRVSGLDPVEEVLAVLERRKERSGFETASRRDILSDLARRGITAYAERAVLLRKSVAPWRIGHGNPAPYELLTGSGMKELLEASLGLLTDLVLGHRRFVFVPSAPANRVLLTIGDALRPLEFAIVDTLRPSLERIVEQGHYRGDWGPLVPRVKKFVAEAGSKIVIGTYRASSMAPSQLFYAHEDHAQEAALIALADSVLQEHKGFPMLIDLANTVCGATFGTESFGSLVDLAYVEAGEPFRYAPERQSRR